MLIISPVAAQRKNKTVSSGEYVQQVVNSSTFEHMPITVPAMLSPLFPFGTQAYRPAAKRERRSGCSTVRRTGCAAFGAIAHKKASLSVKTKPYADFNTPRLLCQQGKPGVRDYGFSFSGGISDAAAFQICGFDIQYNRNITNKYTVRNLSCGAYAA